MRARAVTCLLAVALLVGGHNHHAAAQETDGTSKEDTTTYTGGAGEDDLGIEGTGPASGGAENGGSNGAAGSNGGSGGGNSSPADVPLIVTERTYVPTCGGNRPDAGNDALCGMAVGACPVEEDTAYWVYTRTRNTQTGAVSPWVRITDPPFDCRGATDPVPAVPIEQLIGDELERDFATLALPRAGVEVRPSGQTLVNIPTRFYTGTTTTTLDPIRVLGRTVRVTAIAQRYDWSMGDGTTYPNAGPASGAAPIEHTYEQGGPVGPYVTVTWGGTFTVEGIAGTFQIRGTATTQGPPADLVVRTARSELVRD